MRPIFISSQNVKMNKTIWKFELEVIDRQSIHMPIGAEILTIQIQKEKPCLWALVDSDKNTEKRFIEIFGTGNPIDNNVESRKYISTFQLHGGELVFHAFERLFTELSMKSYLKI